MQKILEESPNSGLLTVDWIINSIATVPMCAD